jgi:SAM-dependent methyltransferase
VIVLSLAYLRLYVRWIGPAADTRYSLNPSVGAAATKLAGYLSLMFYGLASPRALLVGFIAIVAAGLLSRDLPLLLGVGHLAAARALSPRWVVDFLCLKARIDCVPSIGSCPACNSTATPRIFRLKRGGSLWLCSVCAHRRLLGWKVHPELDEYAAIDPASYRRSMWPERRSAATAIIRELRAEGGGGPLLDVGCSFGWLLQAAKEAGIEGYGIEPSESAVAEALAQGLRVRQGFFPEETWNRREWGAICFMDVLEHLENPALVVQTAVDFLRPGGFLAIQLPVSDGPVFGSALALARLSGGRWDDPLHRMLQTDFPFPHLHYFSTHSLRTLLSQFGLKVVRLSHSPIATGHFTDRVAWDSRIRFSHRILAAGLRSVLLGGRILGRYDLVRVIATLPEAQVLPPRPGRQVSSHSYNALS